VKYFLTREDDQMREGRVEGVDEGMAPHLMVIISFSQLPFTTWSKCFCFCLTT